MREVERLAIEELGVPSIVLMENAALGVVEAALAEVPHAESAAVLCGPGNNGGDGLAIARHLAVRGLEVVAVVASGGREYSGDARVQFEIARRMAGMGIELRVLGLDFDAVAEVRELEKSDLLIDALFGTGLSRPLDGPLADLVGAINALEATTVAVDLPSGLDSERAELPSAHIKAQLTVTFASLKVPLVLPPAADAAGQIVVADLGVPAALTERVSCDLALLAADDVAALVEPRPVAAHKGDFGHLLLVAGGTGKSGAAVLAARGAVRAGAGLVTGAVPATILEGFETASLETMSLALPVLPGGELSEAASVLLEREAAGKQAIAVGPGLGTAPGTCEVVRTFCQRIELPLVLDADGINAFAGQIGALCVRRQPTVLTPHPGELARLLDVTTAEIVKDRLGSVRRAARESGAIVVLKGHRTLIADPAGFVFVNPTGNPGMATGGSGDVLTGMIGSLLAQGMDAPAAAQLGVFVHGLAGDAAAKRVGERSLSAGDLLEFVPASFRSLSRPKGEA